MNKSILSNNKRLTLYDKSSILYKLKRFIKRK